VRLALVVVPVVLVAIAAITLRDEPAPTRSTGEPLPAVVDGRLVFVDPLSLRPVPGAAPRLPGRVGAWARAPDGSGVVVADDRGSVLRFVRGERVRALDVGARGQVAALAWPRPDRVWLALAAPGCCATGTTTVAVVDPIGRRVVARRRLAAGLARVAETPDGLVLLLAPSATIGLASLATVDAAGRVETVALEHVSAGLLPTEGVPFILRARRPGLAVDPARRRAYVILGRPEVVEVDLQRRRVVYHPLTPARSLLERLHDLVEPPAQAQPTAGPVRTASWLEPGVIAVAGRDSHVRWRADGGLEQAGRPAGLELIETERWQTHALDERAAGFRAAHGLVLTTHAGLTVYHADGRTAFRLFGDRPVELAAVAGSLAYVRAPDLHIVDLAAGRVVARVARPPRLLPERTAWE
jgi:hypothetical protein